MRIVSNEALAILSQPYGAEPVNILRVYWTNNYALWYSDKNINVDIPGKILEMSAFDDVVNFDGNNATQTFNVTLDDVDGTIKDIYDFHDIHKAQVKVYQWFTGLPLQDMFLIFNGEINSPIAWKEGERTLTFAIVSQIEDQETGFAPEEGDFDSIPSNLIGKAWPLPFGTCLMVPAEKLDPIPSGLLLDTVSTPDPSLPKQINDLTNKVKELTNSATLAFNTAITCYNAGMNTSGSLVVDDYWQNLGDQYTSQGNNYLQQAATVQVDLTNLDQVQSQQNQLVKTFIKVHNGKCFPQGQQASTTLQNGTKVNGSMNGDQFNVSSTEHPQTDLVSVSTSVQTGGNQSVVTKYGLAWEPSDQPFKITSPMPVAYLCCMLQAQVANVWAYKNYNDGKQLLQVPPEYYTVSYVTYNDITTTQVTLNQPLTTYDKKWEDNLFVDLISPVGPDTVNIIIWLIENYTTKGFDSVSFTRVQQSLNGCPSNFCMLTQENIIKLLSDIAYQARCALILKEDVFGLIFLPNEPAPVDTITENDIISNTLEIDHTTTENIVTKFVSSYVTSYLGDDKPKIIIRNNTLKYGIHEQQTNWFIYTDPSLVDLATSYWAIQKSNTWKLLKFKTPLHKIRLETFDPILINFVSKFASLEPVTGIIQSVKLDTKELNLEFEVWLPVLLGTMTKYNFAWPPDSDEQVDQGELSFQKMGSQATGNLGPQNGASICGPSYKVNKGARQKVGDPTVKTPDDTTVPLVAQSDSLDRSGRPVIPYNYNQYSATPFTIDAVKQGSYPAKITSPIDDKPGSYNVIMYTQGLTGTGTSTSVIDVTKGPTIANDTWVTVLTVVWQKLDPTTNQNKLYSEKYLVPSTGTSTFMGKIVDEGDEDDTYRVELYENGLEQPSTRTITTTQVQIAEDEIIPNGTWAVIVTQQAKVDNVTTPEYVMQVPVWVGTEDV